MLRNAVIAVACLLIVAGLVCLATAPDIFPAWLWLFGAGGFLLMGTLYEQVSYKPLEMAAPGLGWQRTTERFVDGKTGKTVTVYIEPKTGERKYVSE